MLELYAISYSPWSERARWALDYHELPYREREYLPIFGTPLLRLRARRFSGRITVPLLIGDDDVVLMDSFDIARHADAIARGGRPSLVPDEHRGEIERYNALSEAALAAGRARVTPAVVSDPAARRESVPAALRPLAARAAALGGAYLRRKYDTRRLEGDVGREAVVAALDALRAGLATGDGGGGGGDYLLGRLTYADITMASMLQVVEPVRSEAVPMGESTRRCWRDAELASSYADVVAWRDALYARHRAR
ncbi:MAG: glutathione S-transferase domain-containing protein [Myxococcales bacterium]|nr:glutathione S-transferase domain-containing protein [Myxococcales bacterium]